MAGSSGVRCLVTQLPPQNLADIALRQLRPEFDVAWHLVRGEVLATMRDKLFRRQSLIFPDYKDRQRIWHDRTAVAGMERGRWAV